MPSPRKTFEPQKPLHLWHHVTPRQRDILVHLIAGMSNREISVAIKCTEGTVKEHVQSLLDRLGAASRQQLAVWAAVAMIDDGEGDLSKIKEISEFDRCMAMLRLDVERKGLRNLINGSEVTSS